MKLLTYIKKVGLIIPLFLFKPVQAQNENLGLSFTPQANVLFSYCGLDAQEHKSFKISPEAGIKVKLDISKHVGFTTGVFYNQKAKYYQYQGTHSFFTDLANSFFGGFGIDTLIEDVIGTTSEFINDTIYDHYAGRVNIHYLQVPLMATVDIKNFSFSAGAYLGFKIGASATETLEQDFPLYTTISPAFQSDPTLALVSTFFTAAYPALDKPVVTDIQNINYLNSFDYGLMAELTGRFDQRFSMSLSATYGLSDYSNDPARYPGKHFTVSFGMGASFGKVKGTLVPMKMF